jgi:hypothetical protein
MNVERSKVFGMPLPELNLLSPADKAEYLETNTLNGTEALCKLLALYESLLVNINQQVEGRSGLMLDESLARLDLAMRYLTTARREFYRSLREYQDAKKSS